jgi:predicted site-specific integrase-resolvase
MDKDLLKESEAANILCINAGTLSVWRSDGYKSGTQKIPFIKVGKLVRYKRTDIESWIALQGEKAQQERRKKYW